MSLRRMKRRSNLTYNNYMNPDLPYYVGFSHFLGIGPIRFKKIKASFPSIKTAYNASYNDLKKIIGETLTQKFVAFRNTFDTHSIVDKLYKKNIHILCLDDKAYPKQLVNIEDTPICLYLVGNKKLIEQPSEKNFAIVGTRKASSYGLNITRLFTTGLSNAGFTIVSGMALGIDSSAHQATIDCKGKTIAVLCCGVDIVYPPSNYNLYQNIIKSQGLIISEFPPGLTVLKGLFVARNRLISGLSCGVLVVEGAINSGALITAKFAGQQGRDVFAPPSPITSNLSFAPNLLIKNGAKMVTCVDDILEEYNINRSSSDIKSIIEGLNDLSKKIVIKLAEETQSADDLSRLFGVPVNQILDQITNLEIDGLIGKSYEGNYYLITLEIAGGTTGRASL